MIAVEAMSAVVPRTAALEIEEYRERQPRPDRGDQQEPSGPRKACDHAMSPAFVHGV